MEVGTGVDVVQTRELLVHQKLDKRPDEMAQLVKALTAEPDRSQKVTSTPRWKD